MRDHSGTSRSEAPGLSAEQHRAQGPGLADGGPVRLLLVDDSPSDTAEIERALRSVNPDVAIEAADRGEVATRLASEGHFDIAILDGALPDMGAIDVLRGLAGTGLPVIIATGVEDQALAVEALQAGAIDYLVKEEGYLRRLPRVVFGAVNRSRLDRENRRLATEAQRQAQLLEAILDIVPGAIAILRGADLQVGYANPAFQALMPVPWQPGSLGPKVAEILPPGGATNWHEALAEVNRSGEPAHLQDVELSVNGSGPRYFQIHALPLNEASAAQQRSLLIVLWEVTQEVEARQGVEEIAGEAEAQRAWLQAVIDQLPAGVHIARAPDVQVLLENRRATEIMGPLTHLRLDSADVPLAYGLFNPDGSAAAVEDLPLQRAIWRDETVVGQELKLIRTDNRSVDLLVNAAPIHDPRGNLVGGVAVFQDITQIKDVDRIKDEFLSIASHELRTPLTNVKAAAQLVLRRAERGQYPERETEYIRSIVQQTSRMARLIDELLDVTRLQGGPLQLHFEAFDLAILARETVEHAQVAHPQFRFELEAEERVWVNGDRDRIAQVLSNLLDNAVKYSGEPGEATISVRARNEEGVAEMQVRDQGVGFEPSQRDQLFERFSRLGNSSLHSRGMGLGLFISKQIMAAHGGDVTAASPGTGQGATFTVTLPLFEK